MFEHLIQLCTWCADIGLKAKLEPHQRQIITRRIEILSIEVRHYRRNRSINCWKYHQMVYELNCSTLQRESKQNNVSFSPITYLNINGFTNVNISRKTFTNVPLMKIAPKVRHNDGTTDTYLEWFSYDTDSLTWPFLPSEPFVNFRFLFLCEIFF